MTASLTADYWGNQRDRQRQAELETLAEAQRNPDSLLQQAFQQDVTTAKELRKINAALRLTSPKIPYSRKHSKLLIECSKLATQQYLKGKIDPAYDGTLTSLPAYRSNLDRYRLIAVFKGVEEEIEETVDVNVPVALDPVYQQVEYTEATVQKTLREAVKLKRKIPVFFGFVLSSDTDSLIVFRGTQRTVEWIDDLTALQRDYPGADAKQSYGKIHQGFWDVYQQILTPLPTTVAQQLNPSRPCFIGGHSLGGPLAILAAIEIALKVPRLRSQLQLYSYASPRVGDPAFAELHSRLIPNSYRVVNLADTIPLVPPTKLDGTYVHIGQEWAFLSQNGDVLPNHVVDTYRNAIERELESYGAKTYQNLLRDI
ncbi:lipase family protein [Chlorogloea sp. CCALA 695]|uniref:lipase family protein n=1 Tax=Chlorogloea sp. CCALA 695 TaxID=2107693 RepID=UPI001E5EA8F8|nr:lipase [Chlorogloea sp. CCALA 695]